MKTEKVKKSDGRNNNGIIIAVTIVVLAVIFMYFHDRQQKRQLQLQQIDTQTDVWEEWGPPGRQLNNAPGDGGGKIL
ncbi:MAG: hypothetical protein ACYS1A_10965 [Planctomycetota bacterium]